MLDIDNILEKDQLDKADLIKVLHITDSAQLERLYNKADEVRKEYKGDIVHMRGIIEFSNYCARWCAYCGLNAGNTKLQRYRMSVDEIVYMTRNVYSLGYKTVVLQSGEDNYYTIDLIEDVIRRIKSEMNIFITLGLGERPEDEYKRMKDAGADRYLLKHETSDKNLYKRLHPDMEFENRINCLKILKKLGFEVGSGIMIGLPLQSIESLADDILLFKELKIDMVGMGPFISHPATDIHNDYLKYGRFTPDIDYDLEEMVYKVLALTRIVNKNVNLPATTALATTNPETGREKALSRGANVLMPNLTDEKYRSLYEIYPSKACVNEKPEECSLRINQRVKAIGRVPF